MRKIIFILMALLASTGAGAEAENIVAKVKVRNGGTITWIDIRGTIDGTNFTTAAYYINDDACISWETTGAIDLNEVWSGEGSGTHYTVTSIGEAAFQGCYALTSIEIPSSVTRIGDQAFYGCGLTSVKLQEGVTSIGNRAFLDCSHLTSIELPSSVTSIGNRAFEGCMRLTEIKVQEGNTVYDSRNNCNALIETASNTLIAGCKNTVIPETVTSIGESAFLNCQGLTSIEIPSSVTSIGNRAFSGCSNLTSIVIPSSVTSIGGSVFYCCVSLTSIEIPDGVTSIGEFAFYGCI